MLQAKKDKIKIFQINPHYSKIENIQKLSFNDKNKSNNYDDINIKEKKKIKYGIKRQNDIFFTVHYKFHIIIIKLLLLLDLFISGFTDNNLFSLKIFLSKVKLKIKGSGDKKIYSQFFYGRDYLEEIYINNVKQETIKNIYTFSPGENLVEIRLDTEVDDL